MKKLVTLVLALACILALVGCSNRSMNYIIANEPNITGIVEEVHDNYIIIFIESDGYPNGAECKVTLNAENGDGIYSPITVGDEVTIYYNGDIAESDPLQINTVYAILLTEPADRTVNETS